VLIKVKTNWKIASIDMFWGSQMEEASIKASKGKTIQKTFLI
jgi:hypothetical protein